MECKWRPQTRPAHTRRPSQSVGESSMSIAQPGSDQSPITDSSSGGPSFQPLGAVDEVFDYASFMWDGGGDLWQQVSPDIGSNVGLNTHVMVCS
jgi:hypothetical protein